MKALGKANLTLPALRSPSQEVQITRAGTVPRFQICAVGASHQDNEWVHTQGQQTPSGLYTVSSKGCLKGTASLLG